ncbi:MAG: hypothetical protein KBB52_03085 [Candidatus Omnitrophica bacterium]|nr:hypothetical protein [Candidatus Omnitrophota bacterium]
MKKIFLFGTIFVFGLCSCELAGCGYTTQSLLPSKYRTIYVENFKNSIKVTAEQTNIRMYRGYRPGMEIDITKTVIDRYLFDGNLRIAQEGAANLILRGELIDFKRDPLRYDTNDNIEEYRIKLIVNLELIDADTGESLWKENGFAGETTYRTSGPLAMTEDAAVNNTVKDLARRIVERTVEAW